MSTEKERMFVRSVCFDGGDGCRQVMTDGYVELQPVHHRRIFRDGREVTYQGPAKAGDLLFRARWHEEGDQHREFFEVRRFYPSGNWRKIDPAMAFDLWERLREKHQEVYAWVDPKDDKKGCIPGCDPKDDVALVHKRWAIKSCLRKFGLHFSLLQQLEQAPRSALRLRPEPLDFDPNEYTVRDGDLWIVSTGERVSKELKELRGWEKWPYLIHVTEGPPSTISVWSTERS